MRILKKHTAVVLLVRNESMRPTHIVTFQLIKHNFSDVIITLIIRHQFWELVEAASYSIMVEGEIVV